MTNVVSSHVVICRLPLAEGSTPAAGTSPSAETAIRQEATIAAATTMTSTFSAQPGEPMFVLQSLVQVIAGVASEYGKKLGHCPQSVTEREHAPT